MAAKTKIAPDTDITLEPVDTPKQGKKAKRGAGGKIIALFVVLIIIAFLASLVVLDLFGMRSKYLQPALENVPIVKNLFPTNTSDEVETPVSVDDLKNSNTELTADITALQEQVKQLEQSINLKNEEILRLTEYEEQQVQFREDKAEFDRLISLNDPEAYSRFFSSIDPENAERLYPQAVLTTEQAKELKDYIAKVRAMDESSAAKMLEELVLTDLNLVVRVIRNLDDESSGAILGSMQPKNAASVMKRMAPVE